MPNIDWSILSVVVMVAIIAVIIRQFVKR